MSGYIVALLATAAAEMFRHVLYGVSGNAAPFLPFTLAVLVTAWMGGLRPGLLATALGTVLSLFPFVSPQFSFALAGMSGIIGAILFVMTGVSISAVCESLHAARHKAERERIAATLESITDAFTRFDRDWRIIYVNARRNASPANPAPC